jgi:hypothetical protein
MAVLGNMFLSQNSTLMLRENNPHHEGAKIRLAHKIGAGPILVLAELTYGTMLSPVLSLAYFVLNRTLRNVPF